MTLGEGLRKSHKAFSFDDKKDHFFKMEFVVSLTFLMLIILIVSFFCPPKLLLGKKKMAHETWSLSKFPHHFMLFSVRGNVFSCG